MAPPRARFLACLLTAIVVLPFPAAAFDTPLSDTAVREAYFLGQRSPESRAHLFDKYTKHLSPPKSGPYVSSVAFFTPFALVAELSSQRTGGYSAQQAEIDHRNHVESVRVVVQFRFIDAGSGSAGYPFRPDAFWKDYDFQVRDDDHVLKAVTSSAEPNYICSDDGGCIVTGATLSFVFLAESFTADNARVRVIPPEGDPIVVDFDLSALR